MKHAIVSDALGPADPSSGVFATNRAVRTFEESADLSSGVPESMRGVVSQSEALIDCYRLVERVANTRCGVFVTGEAGVGKGLLARAVHHASARRDKPLVVLECDSFDVDQIETEIFGVSSTSESPRVEQAHGGTLLLDNVSRLPVAVQERLVRVVEQGEYYVVGESSPRRVDVRLVATTELKPDELVASGALREDLYERLNVIQITVPALSERTDDIPLLVHHFLRKSQRKLNRDNIHGVSRATAQLLMEYDWPENVSELEAAIERAVVLCTSDVLEPKDLPARICGLGTNGKVVARLPAAGIDLRGAVESFENQLIRQALERTGWNKKQAAALLGINRTTLIEMLKRKRISAA
jgi:DNA-binding NtrC family response regulator